MNDDFFPEEMTPDEQETVRFVLNPDLDDDELDEALAEILPTADQQFRGHDETEETADFLGQITGDEQWARAFSSEATALDNGGLGVLSPEEVRTLTIRLGRQAGEDGFTFNELMAVLDWANKVRIGQALLETVLDGELLIGWDGEQGDAFFTSPPDLF